MKKIALGLVSVSLVLLGCTQLPGLQGLPSIPPLWDVLSPPSPAPGISPTPFTFPTGHPPAPTPVPLAEKGKTLIYQLTGFDQNLQDLQNTPSDYLVIDAMKQTPDRFFTTEEVQQLKQNHTTVLSYISIGEAEDYRYYFNQSWKQNPPAWMGKTNPDWPGNNKVRYWYPEWQNIVLNYTRQVAAAGFDGAYLDIIDGYAYWSDPENGENESLQTEDAALKMIAFIKTIRQEARKINPEFKIYPQNAPDLVVYPGYLDSIEGIGKETTWYQGYNEITTPATKASPQDEQIRDQDLGFLRQIHEAGKTVLAVDYFDPSQNQEAASFTQAARNEGFVPYAADHVALDHISSFFETRKQQQSENQENQNACESSGGYCALLYCPPCPAAENGRPGTCEPCRVECPVGQKLTNAYCPSKTSYVTGCCISTEPEIKALPLPGIPGLYDASTACLKMCRDKKPAADLSNGPCLSNEIIPDWVCDVAHNPRQPVDDEKQNQCPAFGQSAHHFIEVNEDCKVIQVA